MAAVDDLASVSPAELADLGIEPPAVLTDAVIPLWRSSAKAKYHWADKRSRCQHLPGARWGVAPLDPLPVSEKVPALGFDVPTSVVCTGCAAQIAISPQADSFVAVAAELARAEQWAEAGRAGAAEGDWSWLRFARWRARQPLQGNHWDDAIKAVRGERWAAAALALRRAIARQQEQAEAVNRLLVGSIGDNPGRSALLEREILMV